ncbi:MAG: sulfatase-like hydrolase/transferase [Peptococcaceae bacterium]|nr:sulfatase-like hydrolase/transferase [Peptococcaceae bacterium]
MKNNNIIRKILVFFIALIGITFFIPGTAYAYIDPATTTYIIQIVSALVITSGIVLGIFFSRIRIFFANIWVNILKFKIKVTTKLRTPQSMRKGAQSTQTEKHSPKTAYSSPLDKKAFLIEDERGLKKRMGLAGLSSAAVVFTFIIFGILDIFAQNRGMFYFSLPEIALPVLLMGIAIFLPVMGFLLLFKGRLFDILISILLGILLAGYIQGTFLNLPLGQLTGDAINWGDYVVHSITNLIIWVLILLFPVMIRYFSKKVWGFLAKAIPSLLMAIQLIALVSVLVASGAITEKRSDSFLTESGMFELSSANNIIIILLDRLDEDYVNDILKESPDFFDRLDGFTRFTNHTTNYTRSFPAIQNMLSGKTHLFNYSAPKFFDEAWSEVSFITDLRSHNYTTKFYLDSYYDYSNVGQLKGIADNIDEGRLKINTMDLLKRFTKLTAFRYAPHGLKSSFWFAPDFTDTYETENGFKIYRGANDVNFNMSLREGGLSIQNEKNNFVFYHMKGSHAPYEMDENGNYVKHSSVIDQTKGCFAIAYTYIDYLKALGLYENSTIIITGDHAYSHDYENLFKPSVTGLFVKPKNSSGSPLKVSQAPVCADNMRATIMEAAGLEGSAYGKTYFAVEEDADVVRKFYNRINPKDDQAGILEEFEIRGDARDFSNWYKIREYVITHWYG